LNGQTPTNIDNGILTAEEASQLELNGTELVVLSACETGLGEVRNGEGVYGLQRAFKTAGAENILMSLCKVPDEQTKELMSTFYSNWLSGKSKRTAFRENQQSLRVKYPEPIYWGSFIMIGK
jgi:CHAT domain-containing protein